MGIGGSSDSRRNHFRGAVAHRYRRIHWSTGRLRKAGTLFKGLCPFHNENTPSFTVSPTRNTCHCFGCGAHGNAIGFLWKPERALEAVRELAAECGVEVPETRSRVRNSGGSANGKNRSSDDCSMCRISSQDTTDQLSVLLAKGRDSTLNPEE